MRWPIKYQIVLLMVTLSISIVGLLTIVTSYFAFRQTESKIKNDVTKITATISQANYPVTGNTLSQIKGFSGAEFLLVDTDFRPLASTLDNSAMAIQQIKQLGQWTGSEFGQVVELENQSFYVTETSTKKSIYRPKSKLYVLYPQATYAKQIRRAWLPPVIAGFVGCVLIGLTGFIAASRISRNLAKLRNQVNVIAKGDFKPMALPQRNDEIRDLTVSVNQMASQLRSYETQVRSNERQKTFEQLGRTIAHELRNAVTGGKMALDLQRRRTEDVDPKQNEYLDVAQQQFRLIEKSVDRFLSLDKPQSDVASEFDLNQLVDAVARLVKPTADHLNVDLRVQRCETNREVRGRRGDIEQAIMNITLNAIEAAASSGGDSSVQISLDEKNQHAVVAVKDSGTGPDEGMVDQLFEPFATNKPDGLGLGLALTKQIVEAHAGTIQWSRHDGCTEFKISIPLVDDRTESK